jgi:hypothetical protein
MNTAIVTQNASTGFDRAYITQDGENSHANSLTLTQQDGAYASVYQQSNYAANTLTLNQSGTGNAVTIRQR